MRSALRPTPPAPPTSHRKMLLADLLHDLVGLKLIEKLNHHYWENRRLASLTTADYRFKRLAVAI